MTGAFRTNTPVTASRDVTAVPRYGNVTDGDDPVTLAATWLSEQDGNHQQIIPHLRERFSLSTMDAIAACRRADQMRTLRRAFG